jgi:hypothetical protein
MVRPAFGLLAFLERKVCKWENQQGGNILG